MKAGKTVSRRLNRFRNRFRSETRKCRFGVPGKSGVGRDSTAKTESCTANNTRAPRGLILTCIRFGMRGIRVARRCC